MLNSNNYNIYFFSKDIYKIIFQKYKLFYNFLFFFLKVCPKWINKLIINNYLFEIHFNSCYILNILYFLQKHTNLQFKVLVDIIVVDTPKNNLRFEIIYNILSLRYNFRLNVVLKASELQPIFSVTTLYSSAAWLERECWDLFGVFFFNNKDLRRILTDYGFKGHPLRKDFPLTGYSEVYYDDIKKSVVQIPVSLAQEYRNFYFKTLWKK